MNRLGLWLAFAILLYPSSSWAGSIPEVDRARDLFRHTEYQASLKLLLPVTQPDGETLLLIGQNYFMLDDYKKSTDVLDKALSMGQPGEQLYLWAGRAYGRRAETSGPFTAPGMAVKSRKYFETAVQMNILDKEATGDLFDYYLGAPGFLGGGIDQARQLAQKVLVADPPEGQHLLAVLAEKDKQYMSAEEHLRKAIELSPREAARVMELARFLAKHGRAQESDALFEQAKKMAPQDPRVGFFRAVTYVEQKRNMDQARALLEAYTQAQLTWDDPPRQKARELLQKMSK